MARPAGCSLTLRHPRSLALALLVVQRDELRPNERVVDRGEQTQNADRRHRAAAAVSQPIASSPARLHLQHNIRLPVERRRVLQADDLADGQ